MRVETQHSGTGLRRLGKATPSTTLGRTTSGNGTLSSGALPNTSSGPQPAHHTRPHVTPRSLFRTNDQGIDDSLTQSTDNDVLMYEGEKTTKTKEWLGPNDPVSQAREWLSTGSTVASSSPTHNAAGEPIPPMTFFPHDPSLAQSSAPSPRLENARTHPLSEVNVRTGETLSPTNVTHPL